MEINNNLKYKLKNKIHSMVKNFDLFLTDTKKIHIIHGYNDILRDCIHLWRDGGTIDELKDMMLKVNKESFKYFGDLEKLIQLGFFDNENIQNNLSSFELEFWSRSLDYFSLFETNDVSKYHYLERLRNSKVVLVGIGGMGSWVLYQLLCMGVGSIHIIDGDKVELSNLNRSIIYNANDVGKWKVDCAIIAAKKFSPSTQIKGTILQIQNSNDLVSVIEDADLLVSCADKPYWYIQQWVSEAGYQKNIPFISASGGRVGPFTIPNVSSCRMCLWAGIVEKNQELSNSLKMHKELPTARKGVLISNVVFTASFLINEIFNHLTELSEPLTINSYWMQGKDFSSRLTPLEKHPNCSTCGIDAIGL